MQDRFRERKRKIQIKMIDSTISYQSLRKSIDMTVPEVLDIRKVIEMGNPHSKWVKNLNSSVRERINAQLNGKDSLAKYQSK